MVTAHTPDHGPYALLLRHAALLQRDHRGGAKSHAAGHVATRTSRTGSQALFLQSDNPLSRCAKIVSSHMVLALIAVLDG